MNYKGNNGFIYSLITFTFISLFVGIIRSFARKKLTEFNIIEAKSKHHEQVGELFDLYRQFYKYESNLIESTNYIKDRIANNESIIFIAINDANEAIGFVQLYETFGSLDLGKIIILYDLYVKEDHRKNNIGRTIND